MSKISLERGSLRISLTPDEARSFGFLSSQPLSAIVHFETDGSLELEFSSVFLPSGFTTNSAVASIPPHPTSLASAGYPAASTTSPAVKPFSYIVQDEHTTFPSKSSPSPRIVK
jgi:hypothetical protein